MNLLSVYVVLIFFAVFSEHCLARGWGRSDQQTKSRHKMGIKSEYKSPSSISDIKLTSSNDDKDFESTDSELDSDIKENKFEDALQEGFDNIVQEMQAKAMNKVYQSMDVQDPIEQSSMDDGKQNEDNIRIAVQSKRKFEFVPVHFDRENMKTPRMIEIVSDTMPLRLHFKSQSAAIVVSQSHMSRK